MTSITDENESQTDIIDDVNNKDERNDEHGCGSGISGGTAAVNETNPVATTATREDYEYVIDGLSQWLNNKPKESETFFKSKSDSTTILVGYAFVLCMNGVISFEMDKIEKAQTILKLLEKRCTASTALGPHSSMLVNNRFAVNSFNWLSNVRYKIFGNVASLNVDAEKIVVMPKTPAQLIEEQIILADVYMSLAILTFLTQDITGLMKGSWLLRKAWKIYQRTYTQLYEMYAERFGSDGTQQPPMPLNYSTHLRLQIPRSVSHFNWISPSNSRTEIMVARNSRPRTATNPSKSRHAAAVSSLQRHDSTEPFDDILKSPTHDLCDAAQMTLFNSDLKTSSASKLKKTLQLDLCQEDGSSKTIHQYPKTCDNSEVTPITTTIHAMTSNAIDSVVLKRLMGAASFGYGIFQLTASLLPAKLLKIISIFGFEGNRDIGVACLMFARLSADMRAVLATLALLWFYTFGTQLFRNEDGFSKDKIDAVANLLDENRARYQQSAIFLFFHGRLERMKANTATAVEFFEKSYRLSAQTELKLLCLHEIAWCKLIQLDFHNAAKYFNELRLVSVYSKAFYTYMTAICQGAVGNFDNLIDYREEIGTLLRRPAQKQSHILTLLQNRVHKFPSGHNDLGIDLYWKYLCYEMLFLWSVLSNVQPDKLSIIIEECTVQVEPMMALTEPMVGLRELFIGCAETALKNFPAAIDAYQRCIERRSNVLDVSMHISAFAHYELAVILIHYKSGDAQEMVTARKLLLAAQKYQNYDLENRLCVQIQQELKKLTH